MARVDLFFVSKSVDYESRQYLKMVASLGNGFLEFSQKILLFSKKQVNEIKFSFLLPIKIATFIFVVRCLNSPENIFFLTRKFFFFKFSYFHCKTEQFHHQSKWVSVSQVLNLQMFSQRSEKSPSKTHFLHLRFFKIIAVGKTCSNYLIKFMKFKVKFQETFKSIFSKIQKNFEVQQNSEENSRII